MLKISFDIDRIKTLGDSFLKYIVVEVLCFLYYSDDVKDLVKRKDAIVSQDNLTKLGLRRQLERKIIATRFDAKNKNWLPPCYYVSRTLGIYNKTVYSVVPILSYLMGCQLMYFYFLCLSNFLVANMNFLICRKCSYRII